MIDAERERIGDLRGKVAVSPECLSAKRADESRRKQPQAKRPRTANTAHESSDDESRLSNDSEEAEFKEETNLDNTASWSCASAGEESSGDSDDEPINCRRMRRVFDASEESSEDSNDEPITKPCRRMRRVFDASEESSEDSDDEPITKPCRRMRRVIHSDSESSGSEDSKEPSNRTTQQEEEMIAIDSDSDDEELVTEQIGLSFEHTTSKPRHEHDTLGDRPVIGSVFKPVQRQGFRHQVSLTDDGEAYRSEKTPEMDCAPSFDPDTVDFRGRTFHKASSYAYQDMLVGIEFFVSKEIARCVMLLPFDDSIVGLEDKDVDYKSDSSLRGSYVRLNRVEDIPLDHIGSESTVPKIPELIYQPQEEDDWRTFAYYYDSSKMKKKGIRRRKIRSLELFAGAGRCEIDFAIAFH